MLWNSPLSYQKRREGILVRLKGVTRGRADLYPVPIKSSEKKRKKEPRRIDQQSRTCGV